MINLSKTALPLPQSLVAFVKNRDKRLGTTGESISNGMISTTFQILGALRVIAPAIGAVVGSLVAGSIGTAFGAAIGVVAGPAANAFAGLLHERSAA